MKYIIKKDRNIFHSSTTIFRSTFKTSHTHTHTLQLKYVSYDTTDQITRTLKILCLFYYSNSTK